MQRKEPTRKPPPESKASECAPLSFTYVASPSGVESNLLILLHGLGDSERPFAQLGQKLQKSIPQTAILSVRGGRAIPLLEQQAWSYWDVWDAMGMEVSHPNPNEFLLAFRRLLDYLQHTCHWPASSIHLFGFAHGATAALEGSIAYGQGLGSVVSVCGELLSHPTADDTTSSPLGMPVLFFDRSERTESSKRLIKRAFGNVRFSVHTNRSSEPSMPQNEQEWGDIMQFWAKLFRNRGKWELEGEVYELSK